MDALVRALERFGPLGDPDRRAVEQAGLAARRVEADRDLMRAGEPASHLAVLLRGWACRYRLLEDGRRQITAFHLPGDPFDLAGLSPKRLAQSSCTLTPAEVVLIPHAALLDRAGRHPGLDEALLQAVLADAASSREWIVGLGRRTAHARTAHLLCELVWRLRAAGSADGPGHEVPLTRAEMADALGLTPVHVGRVLQDLRERGLAGLDAGGLSVWDRRGLERVAGFDPGYLQPPGSHPPSTA